MIRVALILAGALACVSGAASAQTDVGDNTDGGLHWHVAAPGGASWALECRFTPVTYRVNQYEAHRWANSVKIRGAGPQAGRLPVNNGRCNVTKTGGNGPIGLALVRGSEVASGGVNVVGARAYAVLI